MVVARRRVSFGVIAVSTGASVTKLCAMSTYLIIYPLTNIRHK